MAIETVLVPLVMQAVEMFMRCMCRSIYKYKNFVLIVKSCINFVILVNKNNFKV